jgi:thymidylate synthase ThyX
MVKVESKLILTSRNRVTGVNLYTFVLTYPRVILAEVNTHRMLSRNTASSRAIPSKKQRERVLGNPFVPITIGQNQKGMQAGAELSGWRRWAAYKTWEWSRYPMVLASWVLDKLGAHKQVVNRIVEPWTWTQQVVTCTDLKNVFKLRNHKDAEPHFHELARQMEAQVRYVERLFEAVDFDTRNPDGSPCGLEKTNPPLGVYKVQMLRPGDWHLPFIDEDESYNDVENLKRISTARCARVSYFLPESGQRSDMTRDLALCVRLSSSGHWSPFEHVAEPMRDDTYFGNFRSWRQFRKLFDGEDGGDRGYA